MLDLLLFNIYYIIKSVTVGNHTEATVGIVDFNLVYSTGSFFEKVFEWCLY